MDRYFCTFKMPEQATPTSTSYEAEHVGIAIMKLMKIAGVTNTMSLDCAEILKVVKLDDGKTGYVSVFLKESGEYRGRIKVNKSASPPPIIDQATVDKQMQESQEVKLDVYTKPYKTEVL